MNTPNHPSIASVAIGLAMMIGVCTTVRAGVIVDIDTFTPIGNDPLPQNYSAVASDGTLGAITLSNVVPFQTASSVNSTTYSFSLADLSVYGETYTLTWDIVTTASAGDGLVINGGSDRTWVVDKNQDGGTTEISRINDTETITMSIANVVLSGGSSTAAAGTFTATSLPNGDAGVTTGIGSDSITVSHNGTGTDFRLTDVSFSFDVGPANILQEGSFESNTASATPPASPWVITGAIAHDVLVNDARATDGDNVLAMRGNATNGSSNGALYQDFDTVDGQAYKLYFDYLNGNVSSLISLSVTITDTVTGDVLSDALDFSNTDPEGYLSATFLGDGGTYRLTFTETSANSFQRDPFLDNIAVFAVAAIPAPAALPAGLALIGLCAARRRRN